MSAWGIWRDVEGLHLFQTDLQIFGGGHHEEIIEFVGGRWANGVSGPNPAADFVRAGLFFRGSPKFRGGSPKSSPKCLGAPRGACRRLGFRIADLLIIVPAAGSCFFNFCRRLRRALFLSKIFGACGGLLCFFH